MSYQDMSKRLYDALSNDYVLYKEFPTNKEAMECASNLRVKGNYARVLKNKKNDVKEYQFQVYFKSKGDKKNNG